MIRKIKLHLPALAALFLLVLVVYFPFFLPQKEPLLSGDLVSFFWEFKQFVLNTYNNGELPLWNPFSFCGYPFLAAAQAGIFYPLDFMFLFMKDTLYAFHINIALHVFWLGAGMYFLFTSWGLKRFPAFLGGGTMMLSGQIAGHLYAGHYPHLHTLSFMPWTLLFLKKAYRTTDRKKNLFIGLGGVSLAFQILSGYCTFVNSR